MNSVNQNEPRTKITEMSIVSVSIFVAVCLALIVVLMTRPAFEIGFNTYSIASGALLLAILFFLFANDFFLLMIFYPGKQFFGIAGSALYGLGEVLMVIAISIALKTLAASVVAFLFLAGFTLGFVAYNVIRVWQVGLESPVKTRLTLRVITLLFVILGYVIIWKV